MDLVVQKSHVSTEVGFGGFPCTPSGLLLDGEIVCILKVVDFMWRIIFTVEHPGYSSMWTC